MCVGPRVAVLSCAGAYVSGDVDSNECPEGYFRIETSAGCRIAATAAGKTYRNPLQDRLLPRGCFYRTSSNNAYYNQVMPGAGNWDAQLLCAATAGASPPNR